MKARILAVILLAMSLVVASCRKNPRPAVPTSPSNYQLGERYFDTVDYAKAAEAYEEYLRADPSGPNQDRVLFRLGLAYSLPESPARDLPRAIRTFRRLIASFPQSPYKGEADLILALQAAADKLRVDVRERDDRIRALNNELEQLKRIDMQRRPPRPPN